MRKIEIDPIIMGFVVILSAFTTFMLGVPVYLSETVPEILLEDTLNGYSFSPVLRCEFVEVTSIEFESEETIVNQGEYVVPSYEKLDPGYYILEEEKLIVGPLYECPNEESLKNRKPTISLVLLTIVLSLLPLEIAMLLAKVTKR